MVGARCLSPLDRGDSSSATCPQLEDPGPVSPSLGGADVHQGGTSSAFVGQRPKLDGSESAQGSGRSTTRGLLRGSRGPAPRQTEPAQAPPTVGETTKRGSSRYAAGAPSASGSR